MPHISSMQLSGVALPPGPTGIPLHSETTAISAKPRTEPLLESLENISLAPTAISRFIPEGPFRRIAHCLDSLLGWNREQSVEEQISDIIQSGRCLRKACEEAVDMCLEKERTSTSVPLRGTSCKAQIMALTVGLSAVSTKLTSELQAQNIDSDMVKRLTNNIYAEQFPGRK